MPDRITPEHSVGYRGVAGIKDKTTTYLLLCTGGNINLTQQPIMATGVWGAGYANIAPIAWAWNYLSLQGSVNFQLTTGNQWTGLRNFAVADRAGSSNEITLYPDGVNGFSGPGWMTSLSFECSEGAVVTGSFNFRGHPGTSLSSTNISASSSVYSATVAYSSFTSGSIRGGLGAKLIPYWRTAVTYNESPSANDDGTSIPSNIYNDIISWNTSYNSDIQQLKCCDGSSGASASPPIGADYFVLGQMTSQGSFTVFKLKRTEGSTKGTSFEPSAYHSDLSLGFAIGQSDVGVGLPWAVRNSGSTSMQTGSTYIQAQFSYQGVGNGIRGCFNMTAKGPGDGMVNGGYGTDQSSTAN